MSTVPTKSKWCCCSRRDVQRPATRAQDWKRFVKKALRLQHLLEPDAEPYSIDRAVACLASASAEDIQAACVRAGVSQEGRRADIVGRLLEKEIEHQEAVVREASVTLTIFRLGSPKQVGTLEAKLTMGFYELMITIAALLDTMPQQLDLWFGPEQLLGGRELRDALPSGHGASVEVHVRKGRPRRSYVVWHVPAIPTTSPLIGLWLGGVEAWPVIEAQLPGHQYSYVCVRHPAPQLRAGGLIGGIPGEGRRAPAVGSSPCVVGGVSGPLPLGSQLSQRAIGGTGTPMVWSDYALAAVASVGRSPQPSRGATNETDYRQMRSKFRNLFVKNIYHKFVAISS